MDEILTLIDRYRDLLDHKDDLAEQVKQNNAAIEECRTLLAERMLEAETPKISRSGFTYILQNKVRYSKKAGADEELFEILRENGLGDLIKETVNAQTLQGAMSEVAKENDGDLPPEYAEVINVFEYMDVQKRRDTKAAR